MQTKLQRVMRIPEVLPIRGRSRASHYADIKAGLFTSPVHLGAKAVGWPESEVAAINAARIAGKSEGEIKALVAQLHALRHAQAA